MHSQAFIFLVFISVFVWKPIYSFQSSICTGTNEIVRFTESDQNLTVNYYSESDSIRMYGFGIHSMQNHGNHCWETVLEIEDPNKARISFSFQEFNNGKASFNQTSIYFIGSSLNRNERVIKLRGKIDSVQIDSEYLDDPRWVFYYLPPNYSAIEEYPVVYMTDGSFKFLSHLSNFVDYLIIDGQIPPIILVATAANRYSGNSDEPYNPALNLRNLEYVKGFAESNDLVNVDTSLFNRHRGFFLSEVSYWAEMNLNASAHRDQRILQGSSSGGAFAAIIGLENPEEFGHVMVHSSAYNQNVMNGEIPDDDVVYPTFHLVSGEFEGGFNFQTIMLESMLKRMNVSYLRVLGKSGHDPLMWREEMLETLKLIFR